MGDLLSLPARPDKGRVHVVVESPKGSRFKLKYEPKLGAFTLARPLVLGVVYPYEWGFVPSTRAPDGDPLDAMVLFDGPTYPGVVLDCVAIGVIQISQKKGERGRERNDRVIAVATEDPRRSEIRDARDLSERVRKELEQFFIAVVALANKEIEVLGWGGPKDAGKTIDDAIRGAKAPKG